MSWSKWIRQIHRWVSVAFTVGVIVNSVAVARKAYTAGVGLLALLPLALLLLTGLYLFLLPHATRWRSGRMRPEADNEREGALALQVETR